MKGRIELIVRDARGAELRRSEFDNVVVNAAKTQIAHLLAHDGATRYVNRMQFGVGTAAESASDTMLQSPIPPLKVIATVDYPDVYSVRFAAYLLADEGNGFPVSEAGLICVDNTLLARKVFTPQSKTSDYIFEFRWTITC